MCMCVCLCGCVSGLQGAATIALKRLKKLCPDDEGAQTELQETFAAAKDTFEASACDFDPEMFEQEFKGKWKIFLYDLFEPLTLVIFFLVDIISESRQRKKRKTA